jgi:integrase
MSTRKLPCPQTAKTRSSELSFGELFRQYFERHILVNTKDPRNSQCFYRKHLSRFADYPAVEITRRMVQEWMDETAATCGPQAATSAINVMSAAYNWAIDRELIPEHANPCRRVKRLKCKARERFLSKEELKRFTEALELEPPVFRDLFSMCLFVGARIGNVKRMRWDEIDFELAIWRIPTTKNGDSLNIVLTPIALALLKQRQRKYGGEWVFQGDGEDGHVNSVKRSWKRIVKHAGLIDVRPHDLRRTRGSYLAIQGASQYIIGRTLGHRDYRSTAVYARLDLGAVRKAAEGVDELWEPLLAMSDRLRGDISNGVYAEPSSSRLRVVDKAKPKISKAKNASVRIGPVDQAIIEGKFLIAIRNGARTKKELYRKIGAQFAVNRFEMERILNEMMAKKLLARYRDEKNWHCWRYVLQVDDASGGMFVCNEGK